MNELELSSVRGNRDTELHMNYHVESRNDGANNTLVVDVCGDLISSLQYLELPPASTFDEGWLEYDLEGAAWLMVAGDLAAKLINNSALRAAVLARMNGRLGLQESI